MYGLTSSALVTIVTLRLFHHLFYSAPGISPLVTFRLSVAWTIDFEDHGHFSSYLDARGYIAFVPFSIILQRTFS